MSDRCSRRTFLQCASGTLASSLAVLGIPVALLSAAPIEVEGRRAGDTIAYPIPPTDSVSIDRANQIILVRAAGHVFAFSLACPHQNAAVKWLEKDHRFQCSKHDSKYTPDGSYTSGRATRNLDRFPIRKEQASVVVDVTRVFESDQDPNGWAGAAVTV
jgi:nitrite reductase/ring-hydroxylating ferredoxin subunit